MSNPYSDIIHLSRPNSVSHPPMSAADRAAQFSPFAALTGFDGEIRETARLTGRRIEPDEQERILLDARMQLLQEHVHQSPIVRVTYFVPDASKEGGAYVTAEGQLRKFQPFEGFLLLSTDEKIALADILSLDGPVFHKFPEP